MRDSIVIGSDEIAVLGNKAISKPLTKSVAIQHHMPSPTKILFLKRIMCH